MGSGKSTIGPILANVLGYEFTDLDERIEADLGMPIRAYFLAEGEGAFREAERRVLEETTQWTAHVVSLGGGAMAQEANARMILEAGTVVYLRASVSELQRRLRRSRHRPMLLDDQGRRLPPDELMQRIRMLLDAREPSYMQAHLLVDIDNRHVGQTVDDVVRLLRRSERHDSRNERR